jgi:2-phospho-L-lactate guanylyltransferase (CobY/MobA/RfbA family)
VFPEKTIQSLHSAFVYDTLEMARTCGYHTSVSWDPDVPPECERYPEFQHFVQRGESFVERLHNALSDVPENESCILIGSDCPYITPDLLRIANETLREGRVVIGPVPSGGFYLLGLPVSAVNCDFSRCFDEVNQVEALQQIFSDYSPVLLPELVDIDTGEDLIAFCEWLSALEEEGREMGSQCFYARGVLALLCTDIEGQKWQTEGQEE